MLAPCRHCEDRHLGCHSECEGYIEYSNHKKEVTELRYKQKLVDFDFKNHHYDMIQKEVKRARK